MKKFSHLVLGLASITMLASCAKDITKEEALEIAKTYSIISANAAGFTKVKVANKYSDASKNEEHEATGAALTAVITALVPIDIAAVNAAAAVEGTKFKADGKDLEFEYKEKDNSATYVYKINSYGLTTYIKTTASEGWSETSYTWYK